MKMSPSIIKALRFSSLFAFIVYLILFFTTAYLFQCFCFNLGSQNPCPACNESVLGAFSTMWEFIIETNGLIVFSFLVNNLLIIGAVFCLSFFSILFLERRKNPNQI